MTRALGLMCGTSVDAIDVAWLKTDGQNMLEFGPNFAFPVPSDTRNIIKAAMIDAAHVSTRHERTSLMRQAEDLVDSLHVVAVEAFAKQFPQEFEQVELIGYHGQTVFHAPERKLTIQLGRGDVLAQHFQKRVVYDFRAADVAAGGQGAPLVPIFHAALAVHTQLPSPCVFVNIGGVANVTWVSHCEELKCNLGDAVIQNAQKKLDCHAHKFARNDGGLLAFDCGAGNSLIDDAMQTYFGLGYDEGGKIALSGQVDCAILKQMLVHDFFDIKPPKSLDRNSFVPSLRGGIADAAIQKNNIITTLTEFTVQGIVRAAQHFPITPKLWIVAGGGVHNAYIMQRLNEILPAPVKPAAYFNMSEEFLEAQAFAYLAVRSFKKMPLTFPTTTGGGAAVSGGVFIRV